MRNFLRIFRTGLVLAFLGGLLGCAPTQTCDPASKTDPCLRILFIGNSYTYVNDLPGTFTALARSGRHTVETGLSAPGGWMLSDHANSQQTLALLTSSKWDLVILQEQSQIPSLEQSRASGMYPAARSLVNDIRQVGAKPMFFLTWAHRDGWPENGLPDYESMQLQVNQGYMTIAHELFVPVAPVGYAWLTVHRQNPGLGLWQEDGSHPTEAGTYLAACVFYALIYNQSPLKLAYRGNLPVETARYLQSVAADTVLNDASKWNFP
jgi:hypothetical protein